MKNKSSLVGGLVVVAAALLTTVGQANATVAFTLNNTTGEALANGPFTVGFQFSTSSSIAVTALGLFDDNQDGLAQSHDMGLWDSMGNLLAFFISWCSP